MLIADGHNVYAPSLKDEYQYTLSDQIDLVAKLIEKADLRNIILVGASYCGMVITGIANKMPERIKLLVYLDAVLPDPNQSVVDIFALANFTPKKSTENSPTYTEKLDFDPRNLQNVNKLYVLCTQSSFSAVAMLAKHKVENNKDNWSYRELATSHLPMATHPDELSKLLLDLEHFFPQFYKGI